MPPQMAAYRNSDARESGNLTCPEADPPLVFLGKNQRHKFRELVTRLMVEVHKVSPEHATSWTRDMDDLELLRRLRMYARVGMELSTIATQTRAGNAVLANSAPCDADGMAMALNPGCHVRPHPRIRPRPCQKRRNKICPAGGVRCRRGKGLKSLLDTSA